MAAENRRQLSGFTLYVELVTCLTPMSARLSTSFSSWSLTKGITGSILIETGMPLSIRFSAASSLESGDGAFGSKSFATSVFSVVMVKATVDGTLLRRSPSRITRLDFVIIWIRQLLLERISRHLLMSPAVASMRGYGSELLAIETVSPFSFAASRLSL